MNKWNQIEFLNDWSGMFNRIIRKGRSLQFGDNKETQSSDPIALCELLMSDRGEATGLAIAHQILDVFTAFDETQRDDFFTHIAQRFDVDEEALQETLEKWQNKQITARQLHFASEPPSQELFRRLNRIPGGTSSLVAMREALLSSLKRGVDAQGLDDDFQHLLSSWFNRGFLELRRIDWSTSAEVLQKIIAYEAVHEIKGWNDLQQRVAAPDRRLYSFFHPAMPVEPLIFVEVALTKTIPDSVTPILAAERDSLDPSDANTAVFYSISNCQKGLRGISFGNFLIKQVVEKLNEEFKQLENFVTLSPVPGLRRWVVKASQLNDETIPESIRALIPDDVEHEKPDDVALSALAAYYLVHAKRPNENAADPVAHFHLGNGATLHRINPMGDSSENGQNNSWGLMVNYLYQQDTIASNHENYTNRHQVAASDNVLDLLTTS